MDRDRRRRTLAARAGTVAAALAVAAAIVLLPGLGNDSPPARTLTVGTASQANPPTSQTVQDLADRLTDIAGEGYDQPIDPERVAAVVTAPGEYQQLAELVVPAIGLDVAVGNGVDPVTLERGPGHWTGTPVPGQPGNAVISGHRTTHTAPFRDLDDLEPGDAVEVTDSSGTTVAYTVTEVVVVPVAVYTDEVLAQPEDPDVRALTLFACHPEGSLTHRIVVRAEAG